MRRVRSGGGSGRGDADLVHRGRSRGQLSGMIHVVSPEKLFRRYLRTGRPADLAEVFDLIAPELMRMARHLTRDEAEAEDLVQVTWLIAIEKRALGGA